MAAGNFGVVTEFEFALHEAGPMVQFGFLFWGLDQGPAALRHAREIIDTLPDDVNVIVGGLNAPPAPFVPEEHRLQPGYAMIVVGFGSPEEHAAVLDQARSAVPPIVDFATPMPYVELQKMLDEANAWGFHCLRQGLLRRGAVRRRDRRAHRDLPEEAVAAVAGPVLPARRCLQSRR